MSTEKTETSTETPKLEDLIAEAVGVPAEGTETTETEAEPEVVETAEGTAETASPEAGERGEAADPAATADPAVVAETPEEAAVTKELADLGITKPDSQTRFRELANEAREGRQWREQAEKQQEVFDHLQRNGVTGDQFGSMVGYLSHVNSNDPVRIRAAFDMLTGELEGLAKRLGVEMPGVDTLAFHPDLKRRVDEGELDRETAMAWAKDKASAERAATANNLRTQQETASHAEEQARTDLTNLGNELAQRDPYYDKVYELLVPALRPVLARLPPTEWVGATVDAYRDLRGKMQAAGQLAPPTLKPVAKRPDPANAGRPNGAAGAPEPKNSQDAVMKLFGYSES